MVGCPLYPKPTLSNIKYPTPYNLYLQVFGDFVFSNVNFFHE